MPATLSAWRAAWPNRVAGSPEGGLKVSSSSVQDVRFGPFRFDVANGFLYRDGIALPLPPRALGVLAVLPRSPGQVVSKQALLDQVWKDTNVTDTSLAEAVSLLRQALGDDPQRGDFIQTVPRRGYRFVARLESPRQAQPSVPAEPAVLCRGGALDAVAALGSGGARRHPADVGGLEPAPARDAAARDDRALHHRVAAGLSRRRRSAAPWRLRRTPRPLPLSPRAPASLRCCFCAAWPTPTRARLPAPKEPRRRFSLPTDAQSATSRRASCGGSMSTAASRARSRPPASPAGAPGPVTTSSCTPRAGAKACCASPATGGAPRAVTRIDRAAGEGRHAWPDVDAGTGLLTFSSVRLGDHGATSDVRAWSPSTLRTSTLVEHASFPHMVAVEPGARVATGRGRWWWASTRGRCWSTTALSRFPSRSGRRPTAFRWWRCPTAARSVSVAEPTPTGSRGSRSDGRRADGPWSDRLVPVSLAADGVTLLATSTQGGESDFRLVDLSRGTEQRLDGAPDADLGRSARSRASANRAAWIWRSHARRRWSHASRHRPTRPRRRCRPTRR